jgi:hypothetical protein
MLTHTQLPDNIDELKALLTTQFATIETLTVENHLKLTQSFHLKLTHPVTA